ncbi:MAG: hypothetical protein JSS32_03825 [Verrucomicrobia bacterium]|nr:hypothetical protein [Verrucomicrobiota bacterium]
MIDNMAIEIREAGGKPVQALAIGSVVDTLEGRIDPKLSKRRFKAADYSFGFEAGSPRGLFSIGESVLANDLCYATSTDESTPEYGKVIWGDEFVTGGMFLLPKGAQPTHRLTASRAVALDDLYQEIYRQVERPVAVVGTWESEALHSTAIAKPPIEGLPIFENKDYYFPAPPQVLGRCHCFVVGILASYQDKRWETLHKQLEVALYHNPYDKATLASHTHGLILKSETPGVRPELVEQCLHIFTGRTVVKSCRLDLFSLESVKNI